MSSRSRWPGGSRLWLLIPGLFAFLVPAGSARVVDAARLASAARACCAPAQVVDTLRGTDEADVLTGGASDDVLVGAGGDDVLRGLGGEDEIQGGAGRDVLDGGEGEDIMEGGEGDDDLLGGSGRDFLFGDDGDDRLRGDDGPDVLDGGLGSDDLVGGEGDDTADGREGDDLLRGGVGDDLLDGSDGLDILVGGDGNDELDGGDDTDVLQGGAGDDLLSGGDGDDEIAGGDGDDLLLGGDGADVARGGPGNDEISGGDGDDLVDGGAGDDVLNGSGGGDQLIGGEGDDILLDDGTEQHGRVADILVGGPGADVLRAGRGEDRLDGGDGADQLTGGLHTDHISAGPGDDVVIVTAGDVDGGRTEVIEGGPGADTLLLEGFGPQDISEMEEHEGPQSDTVTGPELSFALTDPVSGGVYRAAQIEVIRYVTRMPLVDGWGAGTVLTVLNPSTEADVQVELDFVDESGVSVPPGAEWLAYTLAPLAVAEIDARGRGLAAAASVRLRSTTPVATAVVGELGGFGPVGFAAASARDVSQAAVSIDRGSSTTTAILLHTDGQPRNVHVTLHPEDGGEVDSREVGIPGGGSAVIDFAELFPLVDSFEGSAQVWGGPLSGSILRRGPGGTTSTTPMATYWGDRQAEGALYFPGAVSGGGESVLTVMSLAGAPQGGHIRLLTEDGTPTPVVVPRQGQVDSLTFSMVYATPRYPISAAVEGGSLIVQPDSGRVSAQLRQTFAGGGAIVRLPAQVGSDLVAPIPRLSGPSADVRVALQSVREPVEATLVLRGVDGGDVFGASTVLTLPAGGSVATTLVELFPVVVGTEFAGSLSISATGPVALSLGYLDADSGIGFELPVVRTAGD